MVRPAAGTPVRLGRQVRHRPGRLLQRPGPLREPRRAALLAAQPAPLRAVGAHHPRRDRRSGAGLARRRPPADPVGRPPRPAARRRAADLQLARDRERPAPGARPGRALRLPQRRHDARSAARPGAVLRQRGPVRGLHLAAPGRARRTRTTAPTSPLPCTTGGCSGTRSASRSPTTSRTRRTPSGSRSSPRSPSGSPTPSTRPRTRRSAPRPTCRCCRRWPRTTA